MTRAALPLLGVILALAIGELVARVHGDRVCVGDPGAFYETDPRFGWRHRPGLHGWAVYCDGRPIPTSPFETDARGLLESPLAVDPPGTARILVVGGILPEGLGVPPALRLSRMLQDRADVRRGRPLRVLNAGTASFAIDNVLLWLRAEGAALAPDVVLLVADPVTDMTAVSPALLTAAASRLPWKPYLVLEGDALRVVTPDPLVDDRAPTPAPGLLDRSALVRLLRAVPLARGPAMGWIPADPTARAAGDLDAERAYGRDLVRAILRTIRDEVAAYGATLVVAMGPLPRMPTLFEDTPEKPLRTILGELGIPTVDLGPPLWGMRKQYGAPATFEGTTRLNRLGHFVASQVIWDFLVRRQLLPTGVLPVRLPGAGKVGAWQPFPAAFAARVWEDREGLLARAVAFGLLAVAVNWMGSFLRARARVWLLAATSVALPALFVPPPVVAAAVALAIAVYLAADYLPARVAPLGGAVVVGIWIAAATRWLRPTAVTIEPEVRIFAAFASNFLVLRWLAYAWRDRRTSTRVPLADYLAGVFFFPSLAFGPVTSPHAIAARGLAPEPPTGAALLRSLGVGTARLVAGALLVAASVHLVGLVTPDVALSAGEAVPRARLWLWVPEALLALTIFHAGWTLLARALAGFLGIELPASFHRPWAAADAADFWRRWYVTLGEWLGEHVAAPLARYGLPPAAAAAACVAVGTAWYGWLLVKLYGLGASPAKPVGALVAFALAQIAVLAITTGPARRVASVVARATTLVLVPLAFVPLVVIPWGGVLASLGIVRRLLVPALALVLVVPAIGRAADVERMIDLSATADCSGHADATSAVTAALAVPGRTVVVPAGCRLLVAGPAPGAAAFMLGSGTTIRCDSRAAGFALARRACEGGSVPGAACEADRECDGGGHCSLDVGDHPFAPDLDATYTLLRAAKGATDVAIVGCGIFANQLEPYARCSGGARDGSPCIGDRSCSGGRCTGAPRAPAGSGNIVAIDLLEAEDAEADRVSVVDHVRGISFRGGRRIERCRNDVRSPMTPAALGMARFDLDGVVVQNEAFVRSNHVVGSRRAIAVLGSYVTVAENKVSEARGVFLPYSAPVTGIFVEGAQNIVTHNHVTAFNCVRGGPGAGNVTVTANRCFDGAGSKVVVTGAGWIVTDNYLAWGSGAEVCVGGANRGGTCRSAASCPGGLCAAGAPVVAIGDDGTPGWTAGGTVGGVDHPVVANNLLFTQSRTAPLIAFANPGRRCAAGPRAGLACAAPGDCPCESPADCGRWKARCTARRCENEQACDLARMENGNVTGNLLLGGAPSTRAAIDLDRVGADTAVAGWLVGDNHFSEFPIGIRMPPEPGARRVSDFHVLLNAFTLVPTKVSGWLPSMGDLADDAADAPRTITLVNRTGAAGVAGDAVVIASGADGGFALARPDAGTIVGVLVDAPADGAPGRVAVVGETACNLELGAAVHAGDRLAASATAGKGITGAGAAYAVALAAPETAGRVRCLVGAPGLAH